MYCFKIKLAGVVFSISANYIDTLCFFSSFICREPESEVVTITTEDIETYQKAYPNFTKPQCEKAALKYKIDKILVTYRTYPLHASALSYRGNAYVFMALSGVGKSTHSRLWKEAFPDDVIMINDDRPYMKLEPSGVYAYSHPQSGKHNIYTNISCPVKVIGKIVRDHTNFVKRVSKSEFFPFLVQQSFTMDTPLLSSKVISCIKETLDYVELFEIHCNVSGNTAMEICSQLNATDGNRLESHS